MKRVINFGILALLFTSVIPLIGCNPVRDTGIIQLDSYATDSYSEGGSHSLKFGRGGWSYIDPATGAYHTEDGVIVCVSLNSYPYHKFENIKITNDTYTIKNPEGFINSGQCNATVFYIQDEKETMKIATGGHIEVSNSDDKYTILFKLTFDDGTVLQAEFNGEIKIFCYADSKLNEDYSMTEITQGLMLRYEEPYEERLNYIKLFLLPQSVEFDYAHMEFKGSGTILQLDFLVGLGNFRLPVGEYPIDFSLTQDKAIGGFTSQYNYIGCSLLNIQNGEIHARIAPITSGSVSLTRSQHGIDLYDVKLDGKDDKGNKVTAEYNGPIPATDIR